MDFDEYEYLEKSVETTTKKNEFTDSKREKPYRNNNKEDDNHDEEEDERERRRKRSRSEDRDRGERKRDERGRGWRDRDRERRSRSRSRRHGSQDLERSSRERDRDIDARDSRSRRHGSRDVERNSRERDRDIDSRDSRSRRHGSREVERSSRERDRDIDSRDSRRFKERKESAEPEADPERDQRTVFAYQMPLKAAERDVYEFFSKVGKVRDVRLIMDRNLRRSKGVGNAIKISMMRDDGITLLSCLINSCSILKILQRSSASAFSNGFCSPQFYSKIICKSCLIFMHIQLCVILTNKFPSRCRYIEFNDAMTVPMAIALSGHDFLGQPIMVKPSEAEKNLVQSTTSSGSSLSGPYRPNDRKLYVGNLHFNVTEPQLRQIFEAFGPVELVQLPLDLETGQCKGFGFIQFAQVEHAKAAQSLNGNLEIAGRFIKVSSVTEHVGAQDTGTTTASDFDDDDGGGLGLNARSRLMLMGKLDRSGLASSIAGTHGVPLTNSTTPVQHSIPLINGHAATPGPTLPARILPSPASEPVGTPSECLLLKNLFDPATETDPEFDLDIKEDVEEECSKFGRVRHIYVDKHSAGHVYLRFDKKTDAMEAQRGMHMRWFARRMISAIFVQPQDYEAKFPA